MLLGLQLEMGINEEKWLSFHFSKILVLHIKVLGFVNIKSMKALFITQECKIIFQQETV